MLADEYLLITKDMLGRPQSFYTDSVQDAEEVFEQSKADSNIAYAEICAGVPGYWRSIKLFERSPRLTRWNGKKWILPQGAWREICEKLAAYENIGSPEEIKERLYSRGWSIPEFFKEKEE